MKALCIGRHAFLADHISAFFRAIGLAAEPAVGLNAAMLDARRRCPDLVVCDYDLLTPSWLGAWTSDDLLKHIPLVAVSLTRRVDEVNLGSLPGVTDFLYLPTLDRASAMRAMGRVRPAVAPPPGGGYDRPNQVIATPAP